MADFCLQCSLTIFNKHMGDLAGLGPLEPEYFHAVLCEGCGPTLVDEHGVCVTECHENHKSTPAWIESFIKEIDGMFVVYDETQANKLGVVKTKQEAVSLVWRQAAKLQEERDA